MATAKEVHAFWFGELTKKDHFAKNDAIDSEIRRRFLPEMKLAARAELFSWRESSLGRLSEIIVLDQFSRNVYRNRPESFTQDPLALALAQEAVRLECDRDVSIYERAFFYLPFMHSESRVVHEQAVTLFSQPGLEDNLKFELLHKRIIDQFGRFPHRNKTLGRESTREELDFLKTVNSSF